MTLPFLRWLPPRLATIASQFLRFGSVGFVGFLFDAGTVYGTKEMIGLYGAGVLAYFVAATVTWWLNRIWTFRGLGGGGSIVRQWATFMSANFVGFLCNRGVYMLLITFSPLCQRHPVLAVMGGIPAGMLFNFQLSRRVVFRTHEER